MSAALLLAWAGCGDGLSPGDDPGGDADVGDAPRWVDSDVLDDGGDVDGGGGDADVGVDGGPVHLDAGEPHDGGDDPADGGAAPDGGLGGGRDGGGAWADGGAGPDGGLGGDRDAGAASCTRTRGYWATHPHAWPVSSLVLGSVPYSHGTLLDLLRTSTSGDASLTLARHLITVLLNEAAGVPLPASIADALDDADDFLAGFGTARLPLGLSANTDAGAEAVEIASVLQLFNEGNAGVKSCD